MDRFSLGVENGQADVGRDGLTCIARPNSQARTGTGKINFPVFNIFPVQLTTSRIGSHTQLMVSLLYVIVGWTKKGTKGLIVRIFKHKIQQEAPVPPEKRHLTTFL